MELYLRRKYRESQAELAAMKAALREDPFGALREAGLMAHEIRAKYREWEEGVVARAKADLEERTLMMIDKV